MVIEQIDAVIRNVTEHANEVNKRWGFNRLPHLVSLDLLERFKRQKQKWELACFECCASLMPQDLERIKTQGEAMKRGYAALEAEAVAQGKSPAPPGQWGFELKDGTPIVLVRSRSEMGNVERAPGAQVWCLEEIGEIISRFPELVLSKDAFPDAEIIKLTPDHEARELVDDILEDIPFGG
jgi:hypothetical protein